MKVYVILVIEESLDVDCSKETGFGGAYASMKDAKIGGIKILRDHFWNTNQIELPKDISFKEIRELAMSESPSGFGITLRNLNDDFMVSWVCSLQIVETTLKSFKCEPRWTKSQVQYQRVKASNGQIRYYKVNKNGKKKRISLEQYKGK